MVARDNGSVFCNPLEFAEHRRLIYEGITYEGINREGIPVVLTGTKEKDRRQLVGDQAEGLFRVNATLHCDAVHLSGVVPEKGSKLRISEDGAFYQTYYIVTSACQMGMVTLELEAMDE